MNLSLKSAGSRFAHLFGHAPKLAAKAKAEGDDDKDEKDKKDDARAEGDDDGGDDKDEKKKDDKSKSKAKAEGDDDEDEKCEAEDDDADKDEKKDEKSKSKSKAQTYAAGVEAERARWSDTFASAESSGRVPLACTLLAETDMTSAQIVKALAATPAQAIATARSERLDARMRTAAVPTPGAGGEAADQDEATKIANQITAAAAKARGETKAAA